ncbi:MAG: FAD-binding oxidoreductase [Patescibacteria group bacterium]
MKNDSPWLHQLLSTRPIDTLHGDLKTDVAIVGAGIAGVMTAYYVLKHTDKQVVLIEGYKVAHGSTGHNAGQIVSDFEREFFDIVQEFGLDKAADAERAIRSGWILLEEIFQEAKLTTPMSTFMGYNGYASITRVLEELKNNALRGEAGIPIEEIYIADDAEGLADIPTLYKNLYSVVPRVNVLSLLESSDTQYVAAMPERKGCVNSALLVEEVVGYLIATYKGRFLLAEHTPISRVVLERGYGVLHSTEYTVTAEKIILCTNGFEKFTIENNDDGEIDTEFHHNVQGAVGYMAAYLEPLNKAPTSLSYFDAELIKGGHAKDVYHEEPYIYLTRRPYEVEKNEKHNLICVGGPEVLLEDTTRYEPDSLSPEDAIRKIDKFLHQTYMNTPHKEGEYRFQWHGLLCYTPTGIRLIGKEPRNHVLLYNLGCNGVGILPSVYGGRRISQIIAGEQLPPSIFDPRIRREEK